MRRIFKFEKSRFKGIIYILESVFGLCLTVILFTVIYAKAEAKNEDIETMAFVICFVIDAIMIGISIKMKTLATKRERQKERNPDHATGISKLILKLEHPKKIINTAKMIIMTLSLCFFILAQ